MPSDRNTNFFLPLVLFVLDPKMNRTFNQFPVPTHKPQWLTQKMSKHSVSPLSSLKSPLFSSFTLAIHAVIVVLLHFKPNIIVAAGVRALRRRVRDGPGGNTVPEPVGAHVLHHASPKDIMMKNFSLPILC